MKKEITKDKWIWMPHPAHYICASDCKFFLSTKVGKYIVSTVGEYFPDSQIRKIFARSRGIAIAGIGDEYDSNYMKNIGFEDIGHGRKYETMVFEAVSSNKKGEFACRACPFHIKSGKNIDFRGYNESGEAYNGHLKMCKKWSRK